MRIESSPISYPTLIRYLHAYKDHLTIQARLIDSISTQHSEQTTASSSPNNTKLNLLCKQQEDQQQHHNSKTMGFLDNVFGGDDKSKKNKSEKNSNNNNNPLANALQSFNTKTKSFQGHGQSLGGSKPGEVIPITLPNPGPLGVRVERKSNTNASAIVNEVVAGGQAQAAGLKRGDILCFAGSNGQEEIMYEMFLQLAKSNQRPIRK